MRDTLTLASATRERGARRDFLDFKVGRRLLPDLLKIGDNISVLGWLPRKDEQQYARQLLLRTPATFSSGRVPLYICPECGDLGCGAVTVRVTREADTVVWSDFHHEGHDTAASPVKPVRTLRDFVFEWEPYRLLLWPFA